MLMHRFTCSGLPLKLCQAHAGHVGVVQFLGDMSECIVKKGPLFSSALKTQEKRSLQPVETWCFFSSFQDIGSGGRSDKLLFQESVR